MKRTLLILTFLAIILTMTAQNKTLVAYFSATGTTKAVAIEMSNASGADLFEITPAQPYTAVDLDWRNDQSRSSIEMRDKSSRPTIASKVEDMDQYSTIYIGFPIWWYTAPTIINTFIESYNLEGKQIILFATSGGSTIKRSLADLRATYPKLNIVDGRLLNHYTFHAIGEFMGLEKQKS